MSPLIGEFTLAVPVQIAVQPEGVFCVVVGAVTDWGELRVKTQEAEAYAFGHLTLARGGASCRRRPNRKNRCNRICPSANRELQLHDVANRGRATSLC